MGRNKGIAIKGQAVRYRGCARSPGAAARSDRLPLLPLRPGFFLEGLCLMAQSC